MGSEDLGAADGAQLCVGVPFRPLLMAHVRALAVWRPAQPPVALSGQPLAGVCLKWPPPPD